MANPRSRRQFLIGATVLTTSALKPAEVATIVIGPTGLTPQELAKATAPVSRSSIGMKSRL